MHQNASGPQPSQNSSHQNAYSAKAAKGFK